MWPFQKKPVVHVVVEKNHPVTAQKPGTRVATYEIGGVPVDPFYFEPKSFGYSKALRADVRQKLLDGGNDEKTTKRTIVKVWRDDATAASPKVEKSILGALNLALLLMIVFTIIIIAAGLLIPQETVDALFPGTALAAVAANAAFFLGNFAVRSSAVGEPFEYTEKQQILTYSAILGAMLVNIAVLFEFPAVLVPETLLELKENIQRYLAILGLIGTVFGAGFSGAFDAAKWVLTEEVQRRNVDARKVVDELERRERV